MLSLLLMSDCSKVGFLVRTLIRLTDMLSLRTVASGITFLIGDCSPVEDIIQDDFLANRFGSTIAKLYAFCNCFGSALL